MLQPVLSLVLLGHNRWANPGLIQVFWWHDHPGGRLLLFRCHGARVGRAAENGVEKQNIHAIQVRFSSQRYHRATGRVSGRSTHLAGTLDPPLATAASFFSIP
jgi:hypothetical protein